MSYLNRKTTLEDCLQSMHPDTHEQIRENLKKFQSVGLLIFENIDPSDRNIGECFAIGYGPNNTLKEPPVDGKCRVTPPNGSHRAWQWYLKAFS